MIESCGLSRQQPSVAGNDGVAGIDQDWIGKAELLNAVSNLLDLFLGMRAGVGGVGYQLTCFYEFGLWRQDRIDPFVRDFALVIASKFLALLYLTYPL